MKNNKWTVGLAAAGLISLASVAQAQLATPKLGTSTLEGYVSTSYQWTMGEDTSTAYTQGDARANRFAIDVVSLTLASKRSDGDWGAGYNVQLWLGPDADNLLGGDNGNGAEVKNAYLTLGLPVGKGLDLQVGRFDTILGMESIDYNNNPHYSHSWGYAIEPTIHEGIKTSYDLSDSVGVQVLMANTIDAAGNGRSTNPDRMTWGGALNLKAPDSMGFLSGATVDLAYITGHADGAGIEVENFYVGASVPLPVDKLSAGIAWDVRETTGGSDSVVGLYLEYAASDKLTLNVRGERVEDGPSLSFDPDGVGDELNSDAWDLTLTANYALWDGVTSRLEYRYTVLDHPGGHLGTVANPGTDADSLSIEDSHSIFANLIYEF